MSGSAYQNFLLLTKDSGVWAFKQMTVVSNPLLHPFVCCGATDRNNRARKFHNLPFVSQSAEAMCLTQYIKYCLNFALVVKCAITSLQREYFCSFGNPNSIVQSLVKIPSFFH